MRKARPYEEWPQYCTDKAKSHAFWILQNWGVRKDVRNRMWHRTVVSIDDWNSTSGGAYTHWGNPFWVELFTRQDEAILHELGHVAAHTLLQEQELELYHDAIAVMLYEARQPIEPPFGFYRQLARDYAYGTPDWPQGMRWPDGTYKGGEIWGGFISARIHVEEKEIPPKLKFGLLNRYYAFEQVFIPWVSR